MAKIVYALNGEGMGHALRSKLVIEYLLKKKHEVVIVTSGRAYEFFKKQYDNVYDIHYYHIAYEDNAVNLFKTAVQNIKKAPKGIPKAMYTLFKLLYSWEPDIVITDFEPFSDFISKLFLIPLISLDNMSIINRADIDVDKKDYIDYVIASVVSRSFVIGARKYIIMTFFHPELKDPKNTIFVPPAIRPAILDVRPTRGNHILIYQTSASNNQMLKELKKTDEKYVIYGFDKNKKDKNLSFKKFSELGFVKDIASSKAVIINGGFTVLSEAIYLKKPILSIPVEKQFEQVLNAKYLEKEGYGLYVKELTAVNLNEFVSNIPKYQNNLRYYRQDGNKRLCKEVDKAVREILREKSVGKTLRAMRTKVRNKVKSHVKLFMTRLLG